MTYLHQTTRTRMQTAANTSTITDTATPATMTMLLDELSVWPGSVDTPVAVDIPAVDTPGLVNTPVAVDPPVAVDTILCIDRLLYTQFVSKSTEHTCDFWTHDCCTCAVVKHSLLHQTILIINVSDSFLALLQPPSLDSLCPIMTPKCPQCFRSDVKASKCK